ncbi:hypothetical protein [Tenuifilum thalassicum]|uniref:Redox-sensing transcriptional repressor Rex n=1 Tax=Tenuifilum thalassicum TaxID=2590900 RepID=A0A7D4CG35_9BACT|nr:hypothetical protein [Tenuifilum thalassicum]QKG79546.1 hypothetical protein FHG85_04480 [Tenuifilum thalassicum]
MVPNTPQSLDYELFKRLKKYIKGLKIQAIKGRNETSLYSLSEIINIDHDLIMSDLTLIGVSDGIKEVFCVGSLIQQLSNLIGYNRIEEACLIGAGPIAESIVSSVEFEKCNLRIVAAFDSNPAEHSEIAGLRVLGMDRIGEIVQRMHVVLAIMAAPRIDSAVAAKIILNSSIKMIWNFTELALSEVGEVVVVNSNLQGDIIADYKLLLQRYYNRFGLK